MSSSLVTAGYRPAAAGATGKMPSNKVVTLGTSVRATAI
jgi:hypothetical protein